MRKPPLTCVPFSIGQSCKEYLEKMLISSCALPGDPITTVQLESGQPLTLIVLSALVVR